MPSTKNHSQFITTRFGNSVNFILHPKFPGFLTNFDAMTPWKTTWYTLMHLMLWPNVYAQYKANIPTYGQSVEFKYKIGFLIAHRESMAHLPQSHFHSYELGYYFRSTGDQAWEKAHNFPQFAVVASAVLNANNSVLGNGFGISGRVLLPKRYWGKQKQWSWNNDIAFGLGYLEKKFDLLDNPKNIAIGSHINLLVMLGTEIRYRKPNYEFSLGFDFTHFSNGGTIKPNLGLNIPSMKMGLSWITKRREWIENTSEFKRSDLDLFLMGMGSIKNNYEFENFVYPIFGLSAHLSKKHGTRYRYLYGIDLLYNEANRNFLSTPADQSMLETMQVGIYNAWELEIYRFCFSVGMGVYAYNPYNPHGWFYHRLGGRFSITERLSFHGFVRSHWAKADFFETGLSYKISVR